MKSVEEIIESIEKSSEVIEVVKNIVELVHKKYEVAMKSYQPNFNYLGEYEFDADCALFTMYDEFQPLVDIIEDVCDIDIDDFLDSDEWEEKEWLIGDGISNPIQFAAHFAKELTDDEMLQDANLYESSVYFYPTDDDIYHLEIDKELDDDFEYSLLEGDFDSIELDYGNERGDEKEYTLDEAANIYWRANSKKLESEWIYIEEDNSLLRRWVIEGIMSLGEAVNVNGCLAIKTDDKNTVKRFLDNTFYSIDSEKDELIETNIPYILDKDAMTAIQYIGDTTYEEDGMTCFCVENDDEINGVMVLKNYLASIGKNITSTSDDDYTWTDIFKRKHFGTVVKTNLSWEEYKKE